jgi:hypothetical protein
VIIGATPEGKKELVGLADGLRESAHSWRELLLDLKRRGLSIGPQLAVGDGALGFWKALDEGGRTREHNAAEPTSPFAHSIFWNSTAMIIGRGHSRTVKAPWSDLSAMAILASGTVRAFSRPGKQNDPAFTG